MNIISLIGYRLFKIGFMFSLGCLFGWLIFMGYLWFTDPSLIERVSSFGWAYVQATSGCYLMAYYIKNESLKTQVSKQ